jgi:hypothetical protein
MGVWLNTIVIMGVVDLQPAARTRNVYALNKARFGPMEGGGRVMRDVALSLEVDPELRPFQLAHISAIPFLQTGTAPRTELESRLDRETHWHVQVQLRLGADIERPGL